MSIFLGVERGLNSLVTITSRKCDDLVGSNPSPNHGRSLDSGRVIGRSITWRLLHRRWWWTTNKTQRLAVLIFNLTLLDFYIQKVGGQSLGRHFSNSTLNDRRTTMAKDWLARSGSGPSSPGISFQLVSFWTSPMTVVTGHLTWIKKKCTWY